MWFVWPFGADVTLRRFYVSSHIICLPGEFVTDGLGDSLQLDARELLGEKIHSELGMLQRKTQSVAEFLGMA